MGRDGKDHLVSIALGKFPQFKHSRDQRSLRTTGTQAQSRSEQGWIMPAAKASLLSKRIINPLFHQPSAHVQGHSMCKITDLRPFSNNTSFQLECIEAKRWSWLPSACPRGGCIYQMLGQPQPGIEKSGVGRMSAPTAGGFSKRARRGTIAANRTPTETTTAS